MNAVHSPLLPQIKTILGNMGYAPVVADAALFVKKSRLDQPLSVQFFQVSERNVQKIGTVPAQKPLSHAQFVTAHVQHLFPKV